MDTLLQSNSGMPYRERLTLHESRHEYGDVYTYMFRPASPVAFSAGSYAHVRLHGLPEGTKSVRELSFASAPSEPEVWFGVDGRSHSDYQQALRALVPGDEIEIFKIKSHITWPPAATDVVLIAGGVGITPFRSMLLDAAHQGLRVNITVIHVARDSFLYADEIQAHAETYLPISRSQLESTLADVVVAHPTARYCLAGSSDFVRAVASQLANSGVHDIESDEFKGLEGEA